MLGQLTLSLSLAGLGKGLDAQDGSARRLIEHAGSYGVRAIRLDGTLAGTRPRDLDRSARRDLASLLRRLELGFGGIDLWVPPEHFADPNRVERALEATLAAIDLCAELATLDGRAGGRTVSLFLPVGSADSAATIGLAADRASVRVADHGPEAEGREPAGPLGVGVDPASVILASGDPSAMVARLGARAVSPRISDTDGLGRVVPGEGRLDVTSYLVSLGVAIGTGDVVLDMRGVSMARRAVPRAVDACRAAHPGVE